jgi:hypothetical protein
LIESKASETNENDKELDLLIWVML